METRETSPDAAKWGLYLSSHIGEAKWTCGPTTNPNAAKCQFFSSRTFDHRRKGAKCASLAFEILSEQYLIWAFTGVTIGHKTVVLLDLASKGMAGAHEPSRLGA